MLTHVVFNHANAVAFSQLFSMVVKDFLPKNSYNPSITFNFSKAAKDPEVLAILENMLQTFNARRSRNYSSRLQETELLLHVYGKHNLVPERFNNFSKKAIRIHLNNIMNDFIFKLKSRSDINNKERECNAKAMKIFCTSIFDKCLPKGKT
jgi:hypothetical protein